MMAGRARLRRARVAIVAVVMGALATGCAGLSSSSPVQSGLPVGSSDVARINITYPGPAEGAGPDGIVRGFIRAGLASDGNYENARKFLAPEAARTWKPDARLTLVQDQQIETNVQSERNVIVSAAVSATIDAEGRYTQEKGRTVATPIGLTKVDGEWRISELPETFGRWILPSEATRLVQPTNVYYISSDGDSLVPDVRWIPRDKVATRLARYLVEPVPKYLRPAVVTQVPDGLALVGGSVTVSDGLATLALTGAPISAAPGARSQLLAQAVATLVQDQSVSRVRVTVDGAAIVANGLSETMTSPEQVGFRIPQSSRLGYALALKGVKAEQVNPETIEPRANAEEYADIDRAYTSVGIATDGAEIAGIAPQLGQVSRWRGLTRYEVRGAARPTAGPTYDQRGFLWVGTSEGLQSVDTRVDPAGEDAVAKPVKGSWLDDRKIVDVAIDAGGYRALIVSTDAAGKRSRVDLTGIKREETTGRPVEIGAPLSVSAALTTIRDVSWLNVNEFVVLGTTPKGESVAARVGAAGDLRSELLGVKGARHITATSNGGQIWVINKDGELGSLTESSWDKVGTFRLFAIGGR